MKGREITHPLLFEVVKGGKSSPKKKIRVDLTRIIAIVTILDNIQTLTVNDNGTRTTALRQYNPRPCATTAKGRRAKIIQTTNTTS